MWNRKYDYQRAKCEDPAIIEPWFNIVRNLKAKYGILDEDTWNFDETGFQMGVIMTSKVVTRTERKGRPKTKQPGNREWVSVVHGINAQGWAIPPLIILKGQLHLAPWYRVEGLPNDWRISVSENGWTDNEIGLEWIKHFHEHTIRRTKGQYRLLILDGHESHHSGEFEEYCKQNSIITACMPAHSSHILQPLDVGCFSPLKASYGKQVEGTMRLGINHVDKEEFLMLYVRAHAEAMTKQNIQSGFAAAGLVPFNPQRVLSTLDPVVRTPSPTRSAESIWESKTPQTVIEVKRQAQHIQEQRRIRTNTSNSPTDSAFKQLLKGFEIAVHERALFQAEAAALREANQKQQRKRKQRRTRVADGGTLTVREAQDILQQREVASQIRNEVRTTADQTSDKPPRKRARGQCSLCRSSEHNARTCSRR
jgi:DDE superfamily endonuclease